MTTVARRGGGGDAVPLPGGVPATDRQVTRLLAMPRVIVDVMPKPEILDPQGKAVTGALPRLNLLWFVRC